MIQWVKVIATQTWLPLVWIPRTHMVDGEIRRPQLFLWSSHKVPGHLCTHTCIHTHEMRIFFNKSDGGDTVGKAPDRGDFPRQQEAPVEEEAFSAATMSRKLREFKERWLSSRFSGFFQISQSLARQGNITPSSWRTPAYAALDYEPFSANQGPENRFVMLLQRSPMPRINPCGIRKGTQVMSRIQCCDSWENSFQKNFTLEMS